MMLEWLGETQAAAVIRRAVERALAAGPTTPDIGGSATTRQFTEAVLAHLAD
jgi:isocitrate/isopropylmalate dehydrogenase